MAEPAAAEPAKKPEPAAQRAAVGGGSAGLALEGGSAGIEIGRVANLLSLQRAIGNRATNRIISRGTPRIQRSFELFKESDAAVTEDHRAKKVRVENISGRPLALAANPPSVSPFGWDELWDAGHTLGNRGANNTHYNAVRMHLINGRLGGPGEKKWNLAPGPAQVNSEMSAGPELAAKNLVAAGRTIWLQTEVSYQNNSTNAHDFTSVVPNKITMDWGDGTSSWNWSRDIKLPVDPLTGPAKAEFENWAADKGPELVARLSAESDQVRAQVFDLVKHDTLRFAILDAYPQIFMGMDDVGKGNVLKAMSKDTQNSFLVKIGATTNPDILVESVLLPLAAVGETARLQELFDALGADRQRALVIDYKWPLLQHLGAAAERLSRENWTIFKYNPTSGRANLLAGWDETQINTFFSARTKPERIALLDLWVTEKYKVYNPDDRTKAVAVWALKTVPDKYKSEYENKSTERRKSTDYRSLRPDRGTGPIYYSDTKAKKRPGDPY